MNDCPQFYLILLEYSCSSVFEKTLFIFHLLNSLSIYPDNVLLLNKKDKEYISVCDYFLNIVQLARHYYKVDRLYSVTDRFFIPQLRGQQPSEEVEALRKQLDILRSTPLKLSEVSRKLIRENVDIPTKAKFQNLDLTGHLVNFLVQTTF